jgi:hypothetical protein
MLLSAGVKVLIVTEGVFEFAGVDEAMVVDY